MTNDSSIHRSVPSTTAQFIISTKLQELEKQKLAFEAHSLVLNRMSLTEGDIIRKVEVLFDAVSTWSGIGALDSSFVIGAKLDLSNLDLMLSQARRDPTFSTDVLKGWMETLEAHVAHSLTRYEFAQLSGKLFNEWLASGDSATVNKSMEGRVEGKLVLDADDESFVKVGSEELSEEKERIWSAVFEAKTIDTKALLSYLTDIFSHDPEAGQSLLTLRGEIDEQAKSRITHGPITTHDVSCSITSILNTDIVDENKRNTLHEFADNHIVIEEISNVLSMRLQNLAIWSWPQGAASMEIQLRQQRDGKYSTFIDPDIIDVIFLNLIGLRWQNRFKDVFGYLLRVQGRKVADGPLSSIDQKRREDQLGEASHLLGIEWYRRTTRARHFCCHRLHPSLHTTRDEDDLDFDSSENDEFTSTCSSAAIGQKLLRILTVECHLNKTLSGNHTIIYGEIDSIGAALPHESIVSILAFFGVPQYWLEFFKEYLKAPLRCKDSPKSLESRRRERGIPDGFALSTMFEEAVLFAMELAVSEAADGLFLYRIGNKFWFGDADPNKCVAAWEAIERFTSMVGLNVINAGSACVGDDTDSHLPQGAVPFGFLKFDSSLGRFAINQQIVADQTAEMRRQLAETKSILGWVNTYNRFMEFFTLQFGGRPSKGLGLAHVEDLIATFSRIQMTVLGNSGNTGGAVHHLKDLLHERFGVRDLPDGYIYLPIHYGGLGLSNPIIDLIALKDDVFAHPGAVFAAQVDEDRVAYEDKRREWEQNPSKFSPPAFGSIFPHFTMPFMSYEDYIAPRETKFQNWAIAYRSFLDSPCSVSVQLTPSLGASLQIADIREGSHRWTSMDCYERWVMTMYGEEVVKRFGSLEIVDRTLIPSGMVDLLRNSKVSWDFKM